MVLKCFNLPSSPPPTRGSGKERIQVKWTCLEMVLWRKSCLHCQEISSSVHWPAAAAPLENTSWMHQQSSSVVSGEQQRWPGLAGVARPQPQYKSAERTRSSQLCLSAKWKYARLLSPVYTRVRGCGLPTRLASVWESVSADMTANRPRSWNSQEAIRTPHVFWCFSLWSPDKWSTMIHVRQTNTCVITKNPSSRVLSHVSVAKHPFTCVHFSETLLHLSASAKHRPTQLTFQRTLKFPLAGTLSKPLKVGLLMYR